MNSLIQTEHIKIGVLAADWRDAIREAGKLLQETGCISADYIESMIRAVEELGPYMVILPGFALAHAAPAPSVLKNALSLITLHEPVTFHAGANDPVRVVLCMSCVDRESHIAVLQRVAMALMEDGVVERIAGAQTVDEVQALLRGEA